MGLGLGLGLALTLASPNSLSSGPPELPGLMAASVWMKLTFLPGMPTCLGLGSELGLGLGLGTFLPGMATYLH